MKRKIIIILIISLFDVGLIIGINYTNKFVKKNNFLIRFKDEVIIKDDDPTNPSSEEQIDDGMYNGEEYTKIGAKIDKYLNKSTLAGYGEYIAKQSIKKTVNPYLIGAMIIEDSRCNLECTALVDMCNNAAKVKGTPGCFGGSYKKYDKIYNSIDDLINNVYNNYWINNKTMPMQFYKNHGRDISWAYRVEGLITKIKNTK